MENDPNPNLRELKIRASVLLKKLRAGDVDARERFKKLPRFEFGSLDDAQLKHALAVIALENGHASWAELKAKFDASAEFDPQRFFEKGSSAFLNRWFARYDEARESLEQHGGFLFPFRAQFFVCDAGFLESRGVDVGDPDWTRVGFDWARPRDVEARARLEQKLRVVFSARDLSARTS